MLRIDVYSRGAGYRVRIHDHLSGEDDRCTEECQEHACERGYAQRGAQPAEERKAIEEALQRAWKTLGHREFLRIVASELNSRLDF